MAIDIDYDDIQYPLARHIELVQKSDGRFHPHQELDSISGIATIASTDPTALLTPPTGKNVKGNVLTVVNKEATATIYQVKKSSTLLFACSVPATSGAEFDISDLVIDGAVTVTASQFTSGGYVFIGGKVDPKDLGY